MTHFQWRKIKIKDFHFQKSLSTPHFLSYGKTGLLRASSVVSMLLALLPGSLLSSKSLQRVPKCSLWRDCKVPQSLPPAVILAQVPMHQLTQPSYHLHSCTCWARFAISCLHAFAHDVSSSWKLAFPPPSQPQPVKKTYPSFKAPV